MIYRRTPTFHSSFKTLPKSVQDKAAKVFLLFKENPQHPSLRVKKMKKHEGIREGQIDDFYRFTFEYQVDEESGETICLFWNIGRHDILDHTP